jgi:kynurenine formamidase
VIRLLFGLSAKYLRTGQGWANENLRLSTHGTTHIDAPWHYGPRSGGIRARTIDEMPLDWFYGTGVVLNISALGTNQAADVSVVETALMEADHRISAGDIVLFRTGNDRLWGQREYYSAGPGVSADATRWLIDRGVRLMGIDAWSFDAPLHHQSRQAKATGRCDIFWAAHYVGTELEYCHMERLANLAALPSTGFTICAFPLKVAGGSAGPARVVAMLEDDPD